jgi:hypothetical protein
MKTYLLPLLVACNVFFAPVAGHGAERNTFSFGVIAKPSKAAAAEAALREAITESDADNLAFVVANGIKSADEPCSDALYRNRKALLDNAKNGLVVSLSSSDWSECANSKGRSIAMDRLNRLRDTFFTDDFSFGSSKIPLAQQSTMPQFRSYTENMRWEIGDVIFATVNLPANNNHYLAAAGRNSEFEDRQIANGDWLERLFLIARHKKLIGIVLFCDGDPLSRPDRTKIFDLEGKRDGFAEIRRQISSMAAKFPGKVLVIHNEAKPQQGSAENGIKWKGNIGNLKIGSGWRKITINPSTPNVFGIAGDSFDARNMYR